MGGMTMYDDMMDSIGFLERFDSEVSQEINKELMRQRRNLELIASENLVSPAVLAAMGTVLTNKYAEGYPGKRYYGGCQCVDVIEEIARRRACELFNAEHANVQPHSGAQANMAVYFALLQPGDRVMGMNLSEGGHLTHGSPVNLSGKYYEFFAYGVDPVTHRIDYDKVMEQAMEVKPKLIVCGASAYPRIIDFKKFREIADACGAYLMVDMAHIAGLVAAGAHPNPVEYAHFVTTTTHKTLRGPRGGIILTNDSELAKRFDKAVFPGIQGGPLENIIAAKAVCFGEALKPEFKEYIQKVINNTKQLAYSLTELGVNILTNGTDNHLLLIDLRNKGITGQELESRLEKIGIVTNKNAVPFDTKNKKETSGLRIGAAAVTSRGLGYEEMITIAKIIYLCINDYEDNIDSMKYWVKEICKKYPLYQD